ncbi:MAG: hypothetical protein ACFFAJ_05470 [Candidatus Hodarchaeota archaeon]
MVLSFNELIGKKSVIYLSKKKLNWIHFAQYAILLLISSFSLIILMDNSEFQLIYSEIVIFLIFGLFIIGIVIGGYGIINVGLFQRPILVLSSHHIYLSTKNLIRSPKLHDTGINPNRDLSLVIVRDTQTGTYQLILEGRKLVHLGYYKTLETAEAQRSKMKTALTEFYPRLYISAPLFHNIDL